MQRKIIKVGTSAAVLIPKSVMDEQGVKIGDMVEIEMTEGSRTPKMKIDPKVIQWTDEFIKEYRPLLDKLADS